MADWEICQKLKYEHQILRGAASECDSQGLCRSVPNTQLESLFKNGCQASGYPLARATLDQFEKDGFVEKISLARDGHHYVITAKRAVELSAFRLS